MLFKKHHKDDSITPLNILGFLSLLYVAAVAAPGCDVFQVTKCVEYEVPCNSTWEFKRYHYDQGDFGCNANITVKGTITNIDVIELTSNYFRNEDINCLINQLIIVGNIHTVVKNTFQKLFVLEELSLSNCGIKEVEAYALSNLLDLHKLDLSFNSITNIDQNTFRTSGANKIKSLNLSHNKLLVLNIDTLLLLVNLEDLHLENNMITEIVSTISFTSNLVSLFLQHNLIRQVNQISIGILKKLEDINLSYNEINVLGYNNFDNCQQLTDVDLSYNKIFGTLNSTFAKNVNMRKVNFSGNKITSISKNAFAHLSLEKFTISDNELSGELAEDTFEGLLKVEKLDLSSQNITKIGSRAFNGAPNLIYLHLRNNTITILENYCFDSLSKLKSLDLSYNNISIVHFDTSSLYNVEAFYSQNNIISEIRYSSLKNMKSLRILDLCFNNLIHFDAISNINIPYLKTLKYSNNHLIEFTGFYFNSLIEIDAGYNNINKVEFDRCNSSTLKEITLVGNNITTLTISNKICRDSVEFLDLSRNSLTTIDPSALGHNLLYFNASFNNIAELFPGQFIDSNNLRRLNLSHNEISTLPYGVFNGLEKMDILDLSYNRIQILDESLLHPITNLNSLILDYNLIKSLNVFDLIDHLNISKLSIGGNQIPCYFLAKVMQISKKLNSSNVIDSIHKKHLAENINGILCNYTQPGRESASEDGSKFSNRKDVLNASLISSAPTVSIPVAGHNNSITAVEGCFICLVIICVLMAGKTIHRFYLNRRANNDMHGGLELIPN